MNEGQIAALERTIACRYGNIAGLIVLRDGEKQYEHYFQSFDAESAFHVFSVTKSILSALIGIAVDQGYIQSMDQKVLDFFPDYEILQHEKTIQHITIKHLLTMTAPYKYETEPYMLFFTSPNPVCAALDLLGGEKPIGAFHYSAIGGTHILSGILSRATGQSALAFARENLFAPLGIRVPNDIVIRSEEEHGRIMNDPNTRGWVVDPQGNNFASWGLFLSPREMAKIGQLYLGGGIWEGRQIVPAAWIAESTREHSRAVELGNLAYGYLWWIIDSDSFAALGDGGNVIYVNTNKKLVIAMTAFLTPDVKDRIGWIKTEIEPLLS